MRAAPALLPGGTHESTVTEDTYSCPRLPPQAKLLYESTEEGQKVKRNEGNTWRHVFRRVANPKLGVYSPAA